MSQASKQVDWCLKKAERDIDECKKAGKDAKHRGLVKVNIDINLAKEHIEKAERYLQIQRIWIIKLSLVPNSLS